MSDLAALGGWWERMQDRLEDMPSGPDRTQALVDMSHMLLDYRDALRAALPTPTDPEPPIEIDWEGVGEELARRGVPIPGLPVLTEPADPIPCPLCPHHMHLHDPEGHCGGGCH